MRQLWIGKGRFWGMILAGATLLLCMVNVTLAQDAEPYVVTLGPGETIEITVNGYCLQRDEPFPGSVLVYTGPISDPLQVAIDYSLESTYIESDLYDTQLAVWELTDEIRPDFAGPVAVEVVDYALENPLPVTAALEFPSISALLDDGTLTAQVVDYVNLTTPQFFGQGTLIITNESDEEVIFYIPTGVKFSDPDDESTQDVAIFVPRRELEFATVAFEVETDPAPTVIACWDLNQNGVADDNEDSNGDGVIDVLDCRGPVGPAGPRGPAGSRGTSGAAGPPGAPGLPCWDLNGNAVADPEEDINQDGLADARDCQGATGAVGPVGPVGPAGPPGLVAVQQLTKTTPINNEAVKALTVECGPNQIVVAGGYRLESPLPPNWFFMPVANFPSSPNVWTVQINAWFARIAPAGDCGCTDQWGFTAYAICVDPAATNAVVAPVPVVTPTPVSKP